MKRYKINKYWVPVALCMTLMGNYSCSDFLDREPLDSFTDINYWSSESNVRTYAWMFYDEFLGYGNGTGTSSEFYFQSGGATMNISDDLCNNVFTQYDATAASTNSNWKNYYEKIRRANLMLERVGSVPNMTEEQLNHWTGVAKFFRAFSYFRLVQRFGDVPYFDKTLVETDRPSIFQPRMSRNDVMDKVMADLDDAYNKTLLSDQVNTVNKNVVAALASRVALYEGTYRKYHNLGDPKAYLEKAKSYAGAVIDSKLFTLNSDYKSVYNSVELKSSKEMLLYKDYQPSILMHSIQSYTNTSTVINGMTKAAIESYACTDGLPVKQSSNYKGDATMENVLMNRDKRLTAAVAPKWAYAGKEDGGLSANTGYRIVLFNNPALTGSQVTTNGQNHTDSPVFGYAEVLLNYAEAVAELGQMSQAELDKSVNLLRDRAGIARLTYVSPNAIQAGGVDIIDPARTSAIETKTGVVSPLIWEIRRERRAELMTWTFIRYYDLMRWKKGLYLDMTENPDVARGAHVTAENKGKTVVDTEGYILPYGTNKRVFDESKHYLNSIPMNEILLYDAEGIKLPNNPGW
ncbi:MAG: RagB/SusD family nutrient uptake outer membrane protein [Bacteroidales bacterium]